MPSNPETISLNDLLFREEEDATGIFPFFHDEVRHLFGSFAAWRGLGRCTFRRSAPSLADPSFMIMISAFGGKCQSCPRSGRSHPGRSHLAFPRFTKAAWHRKIWRERGVSMRRRRERRLARKGILPLEKGIKSPTFFADREGNPGGRVHRRNALPSFRSSRAGMPPGFRTRPGKHDFRRMVNLPLRRPTRTPREPRVLSGGMMNRFLCGTSAAADLPVHRFAYLFLFRKGVAAALQEEGVPPVTARRQRIERLKEEVREGRYRIDAQGIAKRLVVAVAVWDSTPTDREQQA
ncbi:MAG: flagellar biosynthesis anti-sigma factor FlgM [Deltaproteobacteria bacterium]|nr:MAG: flagellar biosynthesis anti-sigma factor FlgM [Deltaproteobacteria bacterium]